jgi:hypothetical protein
MSKSKLNNYLGSPNYHAGLHAGIAPSSPIVVGEIAPPELHYGGRWDNIHYMDLKNDKYFNV